MPSAWPVVQNWRAVGRYMDSDAYNESLRREARATGEETSRLITGDDRMPKVIKPPPDIRSRDSLPGPVAIEDPHNRARKPA